MTPNEPNAEPARHQPAAKAKSPIVTRRRALTMAFHKAVSALGGAKDKVTSGILDAATRTKKAPDAPTPPAE